ncbi:MAG: 2-oxoacid:acceptor oxidoreductase family protein [Thaumarchaeota archaeon]|nr:2-oxoacid:acceptor oxidoreductase family protein [Nitrososphaerota archaeon]
MINVSLHGRGGQGIKTASHIIGTAAFLSGSYVQDQPLYGAERRGAPISAYVRISRQPILERGTIENPSLQVISDDSLLESAADNPLEKIRESTVVLINTSLTKSDLASKYSLKNPLIVFDLAKFDPEIISRPTLGIAVAAATCRTLEMDFDLVRQSMIKELSGIHLDKDDIAMSIDLAKRVYDMVTHGETVMEVSGIRESGIFEMKFHNPAVSTCSITATGNSMLRERGRWSGFQPIIDYERCTKCMICYVYCPDSAYTFDSKGYPVVNYDACKGCNICQTECPVKVITLVKRNKT